MAFRVRDASMADIPALARLHVQTFNETHRHGLPGGPSYELREQQWRKMFEGADPGWFAFVVKSDTGELVGFAKGVAHDGSIPGFAGELDKIYVLRRVHRQGIGRLLLCHVARRFIANGITSMLLFGDARSPSNGFYRAFGAERLFSPTGAFHGGYGWRDLRALTERCGPV